MKQMMWALFFGKETMPRHIDFRYSNLRWGKKYDGTIKRMIVEIKKDKHIDCYTHEYKIIKKI